MPQRSGLGRGLDALIPGGEQSSARNGVLFVPLDSVLPNPRQPRGQMDAGDLEELAASIREYGVLQPLIVTPSGQADQYILIAGERRLRAAGLAGLSSVPVILHDATDEQRLEMALIENVQREDLSPLEEAEAYQQLAETFHLSHEEVARRVGKNRSTITNAIRLLKLADAVKNALTTGRISEGHARTLLGLPTQEGQTAAVRTVLAQDLNVRQTEELVRRLAGEKPTPAAARPVAPDVQALEQRLSAALGTRVTLRPGRKGGSLTLYFYSDEELEALLDRLMK